MTGFHDSIRETTYLIRIAIFIGFTEVNLFRFMSALQFEFFHLHQVNSRLHFHCAMYFFQLTNKLLVSLIVLNAK